MKISYKDVEHGKRFEVYGDTRFMGEIKMDVWTQKWTIHPGFREFNSVHRLLVTKKFESFTEAGRVLYSMFYGKYGEDDFNPLILTDLYKT